MSDSDLARYDIARSYDWNYDHAPAAAAAGAVNATPRVPGDWRFCGLPVNSPLGIPAGPLLNSRWILHYARLGFDVLTYKTVRSRYRASYEPPNLLPVRDGQALSGDGAEIGAAAAGATYRSWAISFGMPSKDPAEWRADVEAARRGLAEGQVLVVSVVASPEPDWTMAQLANDFARCARWAADAGAQVVEANLSCPNVCSREADLYLSAEAAGEIASAIRAAMPPPIPLALKIGLFQTMEQADALIRAVSGHAAAISSTNSITAPVRGQGGRMLFDGLRRGIGGAVITSRCLDEVRMISNLIRAAGSPLLPIAVGGVMSACDVRDRMEAGAHHVQLATAPMIDPGIGFRIRKEINWSWAKH